MVAVDLNPIADVIGGLGDPLGGAAEAAGEAVLDVVVTFFFGLLAGAVAAITDAIVSALNATTGVDLDGGFFAALTPIRQTVLGMSTALILVMFFLAIIRSLAAGEPGAILRAALVDVPAAIMTTVASVSVAWILIRIVDQASLAVTGDVGAAMGEFSASLATVDAFAGSGLLGMIFGLLFVMGAILVWLQLLVRGALLYILVVLAPLGFATRAYPSTRPIARRTIEMGVALILSKFAIAVSFGVGATAIESSNAAPAGGTVDLGGMMAGVAMMLLAAFMPWVIWKAIPVVEAATVAAGVERAPIRGATAAASMGLAVGVGASRLAGGGLGAGRAAGGASSGGGVGGASPGGPASGGGAPTGAAPTSSGGGSSAAVSVARPAPASTLTAQPAASMVAGGGGVQVLPAGESMRSGSVAVAVSPSGQPGSASGRVLSGGPGSAPGSASSGGPLARRPRDGGQ